MRHRINPKNIAIPAYLIIITIYAAITTSTGFPKPIEGDMLLYKLLLQYLGDSSTLNCLLSITLITAISVATISIFNIFNLTGPRSNLPLFLYFILFTGGNLFIPISPGLLSMVIIFYSFYAVFISYQKESPVFEAYNAATGASIAILLYFPFIYLIPILLIAIRVAGKLNLRTFLAFLIGIVSLPIIFGSIFYYYDLWEEFISPFKLDFVRNSINSTVGIWLLAGTIFIWTVIGYMVFLNNVALKKIQPRKIFIIISLLGIGSLLMLTSQSILLTNIAPFIIIPVVFFITHLYEHLRSKTRIIFAITISLSYFGSLLIG